MNTASSGRRVLRFNGARSLVPLAGVVAVFAFVPLSASAAPTSFQLVFDGHHVVAPQFPGGLAHVGTFTTDDTLCASGHAEDIAVREIGMDTFEATRLFTCDGSGATFTAIIRPMNSECIGSLGVWRIVSGTGPLADLRGKGSFTSVVTGGNPDDPVTVTFRATWAGAVDLDATPPKLAVTRHAVAKLRRGRYRLNLTLALGDNGGGPVAYSLTLIDPTTHKAVVRKSGTTGAASKHWTWVLKPRPRTRALRLEVRASDAVGNQATLRQKIPLRK